MGYPHCVNVTIPFCSLVICTCFEHSIQSYIFVNYFPGKEAAVCTAEDAG